MPNISLRKLWRKRSAAISEKDPTYKVVYLGNVLTGWAKGEGCVDKPLCTLWRNYCQSNRTDIIMKITICSSGLQAVTREHGLTEYWAHRVTYCGAHPAYPKVFCWVYRHEGRRLKQELRCHAVLCRRSDKAQVMAGQLKERLALALHEFRREKVIRQNARLSLMHAIYDNAALPTRKVLLSTGTTNYRPPLERSKSAPKLGSIEETIEEEEEEDQSPIEEEEDGDTGIRRRNFHASPVGSLAISETMSDIIQYNNRSTELGTALQLSRSSSQRGKSSDQDDEFLTSSSGDQASATATTASCSCGDNTGAKINYNDSHLSVNRQSCCSSFNSPSHNGVSCSMKVAPSIRPPAIRRRYIRSISVDTGCDNEINDFDDSDDNPSDDSSSSPSRACQSTTADSISSHSSTRITFPCQSIKVDDSAEEDLCNSLTSTDTTETVLDRVLPVDNRGAPANNGPPSTSGSFSISKPKNSHSISNDADAEFEVLRDPHTAEDTITLINCLSHSFTRQMSLPADSHPPEESLTSDQPESLGSHCDSCSSSCGGCSDAGADHNISQGRSSGRGNTSDVKGRLLGLVVIGSNLEKLGNLSDLGADAEEPDNISEESGYAEDKDFLQSSAAENTKILNAQ
ncbi:PTB/PI domain [Trinorchestia longiramus]|nr:PTB/PI domain [Trinorchestia longiramus]